MSDPLARRLAASALAVALVALVIASYAAWSADRELRDLRLAVERAVGAQRAPSIGPPPAFDEEM